MPSTVNGPVHGHATRWVPAAQAIFTTEAKPPWTILAANDLACLVFGVTKAEVRRMGILQVVQEERRDWLEKKLLQQEDSKHDVPSPVEGSPRLMSSTTPSSILGSRGGGITAKLLSKPNSRSQTPKSPTRRPKTAQASDMSSSDNEKTKHHGSSKSRGVILCGDVVPIQKRNGATGSASLWVKEKRVGLIWVLEEIHEDVAFVELDEDAIITKVTGDTTPIWGDTPLNVGDDIGKFIPRIPRQGIDPRFGELDYAQIRKKKFYTCRNCDRVNIPATLEQVRGKTELRVSSFPHIAGIIVIDTALNIKSSNAVFCGALFGHEKPDGLPITHLIPAFDKILQILVEDEGVQLIDGIIVPEHSFRKAAAFLEFREGRIDASVNFLRPEGLSAKHRDRSELRIDVQMRVVRSEQNPADGTPAAGRDEDEVRPRSPQTELCYALWVSYSRHLHASGAHHDPSSPLLSGMVTPLHQPSPGQTPAHTPMEIGSDVDEPKKSTVTSDLATQLKSAAADAETKLTGHKPPEKDAGLPQQQPQQKQEAAAAASTTTAPAASTGTGTADVRAVAPPRRKNIDDFVIIEDMGQGAYGQVKLARHKATNRKVVLKYVTKRRILVDTWTRDRRLGTVPLEIHVLDYLRRNEALRGHPNIVEMEDFFEDDINYYIEMVPHGLPGMDLFDYIELHTNMEEAECRSIFVQVARAVHHLHTKALVVHRDIKDENVILDGEGNIKLIDFGSAAYIKSGPFDVFVGTIGTYLSITRPPILTWSSRREQHLTTDRLRRARSAGRKAVRRAGAGRVGAGHPALHDPLQGEPLLQHRRDHGPRPARTLHHLGRVHRSRPPHAQPRCQGALRHRPGLGPSLVQTCVVVMRAWRGRDDTYDDDSDGHILRKQPRMAGKWRTVCLWCFQSDTADRYPVLEGDARQLISLSEKSDTWGKLTLLRGTGGPGRTLYEEHETWEGMDRWWRKHWKTSVVFAKFTIVSVILLVLASRPQGK